MTTADLLRLRTACNDAIGAVKSSARRPYGPINWADLHCCEASWVSTDGGAGYSQVTIEEAAPEASEFCLAVARELKKRGWEGVHVVTEW